MSTRICLINPPHILFRESDFLGPFQPLGLAYIAAVLEQNGYEVSILDALALGWDKYTTRGNHRLVGLPYDEITAYVQKVNPDIVGIAALFSLQARSAYLTASAVKRAGKDITVVLGGIHPTVNPVECLDQPDVDIVVRGEGEYTMLHLVEALESRPLELSQVAGIGYRENGTTKMTTDAPPIAELDSLPFPARHLLPMDKYYQAAKAGRSALITTNLNRRWTELITSRGCPYQCVFCGAHLHMGRGWRPRSPQNVVNEIEECLQQYNVEVINFVDDNMTLDKERVTRLMDLIIGRDLKFRWDTPNGIRADTIDEGLLRKMKKVGCHRIVIAPESGNQEVLNNIIRKKLDLRKVEETVRLCKKVGVRVDCFFVMGLIGETKDNIQESIAFARKLRRLGATRCTFSIATPHHGTDLYEQAKKLGYLREDKDEYMSHSKPTIETPEFSLEEIDELYKQSLKVNPIISKDDIGIAIRIFLTDPLRAIRMTLTRIRDFRP
ncbi:MAG: radical SAM protein [Dehalococcoidales bacterium]|nr:radical SAM protein [Dehalococcoidales bacterium]